MDDEAFRTFVEVRYAGLLRTAYLLTGSAHTAEDLVQSCLLKALRHRRSIDDPVAYVRRAMVNERTSRWRRHRGGEVLTAVMPEVTTVPDASDRVAGREELIAALGQLPRQMRQILVLRYWEDQSEAETAALLGCSIGTVKSTASRGLARLRGVLGVQRQDSENSGRAS